MGSVAGDGDDDAGGLGRYSGVQKSEAVEKECIAGSLGGAKDWEWPEEIRQSPERFCANPNEEPEGPDGFWVWSDEIQRRRDDES